MTRSFPCARKWTGKRYSSFFLPTRHWKGKNRSRGPDDWDSRGGGVKARKLTSKPANRPASGSLGCCDLLRAAQTRSRAPLTVTRLISFSLAGNGYKKDVCLHRRKGALALRCRIILDLCETVELFRGLFHEAALGRGGTHIRNSSLEKLSDIRLLKGDHLALRVQCVNILG
ncbi:hypothetical protein SELMODRAFT_410207 [Selaginella moellendorffii]|uniref:Uncharacterized protein n=1 Tax=Selaginella moellendorffii TaxID=88036 RepID=D8RDZ7_SELML|nr:hypothetical protein SELMODRAFT_410207 [Selaginella moellendorffii]